MSEERKEGIQPWTTDWEVIQVGGNPRAKVTMRHTQGDRRHIGDFYGMADGFLQEVAHAAVEGIKTHFANKPKPKDGIVKVPYIAFGNDELATCPEMKLGETITCPHCWQQHEVTGDEKSGTYFYACATKTYLCGVAGKNVLQIIKDRNGQ